MDYSNKADELANNLGWESLLAAAKFRKGTVLRNMNFNDEAIEQFVSAQNYYPKLENIRGVSRVKTELGRLAQLQTKNEVDIE